MPNKIASTNAIFDLPKDLNIFIISGVASIIIVSIKEIKLCLKFRYTIKLLLQIGN